MKKPSRNPIKVFKDRAQVTVQGGGFFIVDPDQVEKVRKHTWCISNNGNHAHEHVRTTIVIGRRDDGRQIHRTIRLHRYLMDAPKGMIVDHVDGNPKNNRFSNLRFATSKENGRNRRKNTGKHPLGVTFEARNKVNPYKASIHIDGKRIHLGGFKTSKEAEKRAIAARNEHFGEFSPHWSRKK